MTYGEKHLLNNLFCVASKLMFKIFAQSFYEKYFGKFKILQVILLFRKIIALFK